jgi:hypothetical protein
VEIYYQGTDITGYVQVKKCIVRDTCGKRCDSLEIEFENAADWFRWGPEEDDQIRIVHNGYDTGAMYVNTVLPEDGRYRIVATALPCKARRKAWRSFIGKTVEEIMRSCAMASGMDYQLFGIDGSALIPYIQQEAESPAAFLYRLLKLEGATLKCVNGKYTAIGTIYAQERAAQQTIEITNKDRAAEYRRSGATAQALTVRTPYAEARAEDEAVPSSHIQIVTNDYPALNAVQAGRWARGLLLCYNRQCESVTLPYEFNAWFTAMARIDFTGDTDATGEWLIEEAEHDLINKTSKAKLHRCVTTIR